MINAEIMEDAEQRRLAWRCRRGLLELDIVLQRFVSMHFSGLTLAEMVQFDALLTLPDHQFWNVIQGLQSPPAVAQELCTTQSQVMQRLRDSRLLAEQASS